MLIMGELYHRFTAVSSCLKYGCTQVGGEFGKVVPCHAELKF